MVNEPTTDGLTCPHCGHTPLEKINPLNNPYCHKVMECRKCYRFVHLSKVIGRKSLGTEDHYEVLHP